MKNSIDLKSRDVRPGVVTSHVVNFSVIVNLSPVRYVCVMYCVITIVSLEASANAVRNALHYMCNITDFNRLELNTRKKPPLFLVRIVTTTRTFPVAK